MVVFLLAARLAAPAFAGDNDEKTVCDEDLDFGGYGAPVFAMSPTFNGLVQTSGGRGGAIVNEKFALGGHGNTSVAVDGSRLSYGGMFVELMPWSDAKVHPDIDFAWGTGTWKNDGGKTPVRVEQAALRAEENVTSWFRVAAGPTVRQVRARKSDFGVLEQTVGGELQARFGSF